MAQLTITVPDALIALYNTRRASYNADAAAAGFAPMPALTQAGAQRRIIDTVKGLIMTAAMRQANATGDSSIVDAAEAALIGF